MTEVNDHNFEVFRDCLSATVIDKSTTQVTRQAKRRSPKARKHSRSQLVSTPDSSDDAAELAEFIDVHTYLKTLPH